MFVTTAYHVRWMIRRDWPEVLSIGRVSFAEPWTREELAHWLRQRNCIGMVVVPDADPEYGSIMGYMVYELCKRRLEINNFAVHPEWRRRGVGTAMVSKLKSKLSSHRRQFLKLTCGDANLEAHLFWRRMGFRCTEILRGHITATSEDGYRFVYELGE